MSDDNNEKSICPQISPKHARYIAKHSEKLRAQCKGFSHCLDELYSKENAFLIIQGKDIELRHICSLVDPNQQEESQFACSSKEREMIRQDLENNLGEKISMEDNKHVEDDRSKTRTMQRRHADHTNATEGEEDVVNYGQRNVSTFENTTYKPEISEKGRGKDGDGSDQGSGSKTKVNPDDHHRQEWVDLGKCIHREYPDIGSVAAVCKLHRNTTNVKPSSLCERVAIHHAVESFLNEKLQFLQCTCDALPKATSNLPLIAGGAAGGLVFLLMIIIICCWVTRCKKKKRRKKRHGGKEGMVSYHVDEREESPSFYSEISDATMPLNNYRREIAKHNAECDKASKPDLPTRYAKSPVPRNPSTKELAGSIEYMEPWDSPRFSLAEIDYDQSRSSGNEQEASKEPLNRGSYFVPLEGTTKEHDDGGYETLTKKKKETERAEESIENSKEPAKSPVYFVLEDKSVDK